MIGSEDGGTAAPVDRGPVIAAVKKGSTCRLDRFVGCEGFVRERLDLGRTVREPGLQVHVKRNHPLPRAGSR